MVRSVAGVSEVAEIVGAHEERFDGTGYPAGLSGDAIPIESRIVACAAAHVKLAQILAGEPLTRALKQQSGHALDPIVVTAALAHLAREHDGPARRPATCPRPDPPGRAIPSALPYPRSRWPTRCS